MIRLRGGVSIAMRELEFSALRAQGPGGQNVNKVSNAVQLRFDSAASSLPQGAKSRLVELRDRRIGSDGVIVIRAQRFRSLERNRQDAIARLVELLERALAQPRRRLRTTPPPAAGKRRLEQKSRRAREKSLRRAPSEE